MTRSSAGAGGARLPSQASLDELFTLARRVRILEGGVSLDRALGEHPIFSGGADEIRALHALLRVREPPRQAHCMCLGDLAIELYGEAGLVATLGLHHGVSIRYHRWSSDAELLDGRALLRWLADRGVPSPLEDYEGALSENRALERARRVWVEAAPPCLEPCLADLEADPMGLPLRPNAPSYERASCLLEAAYTSPEERALALLAWFSHGAGPWSGFPAYESAAEVLLDRVGTSVVLRAIEQSPRNEIVLAGAARFLSSYQRVTTRKVEISPVPDTLWADLTEIVGRAGIADNIARLEHAAQVARAKRESDRSRAPIRSPSGIVTIGISDAGPLHGLASDEAYLYTSDDVTIIRFNRDSTAPLVLWKSADRFIELGASTEGIYVAEINQGSVVRVAKEGGSAVVIAERQKSPMAPAAAGGAVAWINNARVPDPERGAPYVVQRASLMAVTAPFGEPKELIALGTSAFELRADKTHLYWAEPLAGGKIALSRMRWEGSAKEELTLLRETPAELWTGYPSLALREEDVVWVEPATKQVMRWPKRGGEASVLYVPDLPPHKLVADDRDIYVLVGDPEGRKWHLDRIPSGAGPITRAATYQRQLPDRTALALDGLGVYWTTGDRVLMLPR